MRYFIYNNIHAQRKCWDSGNICKKPSHDVCKRIKYYIDSLHPGSNFTFIFPENSSDKKSIVKGKR